MAVQTDTKGKPTTQRGYNGAALTQELTLGFFQGHCYRAFKEFTTNTQMRFVATKPFLLTTQELYVDAGAAKATITVGSTAGGTWTALASKFTRNGVASPQPTPDVVVTEGGTISGGTVRDVIRVNAGGGAGASHESPSIRLLPAGTYYIAIVVTGSTSGVYAIEYEELETTTA
jgi:hypothetical protein